MGKVFIIHFECVYQNCTVRVNGNEVGRHKYGYSSFDIDITYAVKQGKNTITVTADNSLEPNCRWYSGSGIFRDVTLRVLDPDHIDNLRVETLSYEPAVIEIKASTRFKSDVTVEIGCKGEVV